jgi:uncharacterized phage-like protein YoqJ
MFYEGVVFMHILNRTCGFIGYRFRDLPFDVDENYERCKKIKSNLKQKIEEAVLNGYIHFICGFELGIDLFFAEIVLELREKYTYITLESALASETQANNWQENYRERYFDLLSYCDKETYISRKYYEGCILNKNKYIVEQSSMIIAMFDIKCDGTMWTINYAMQNEREIVLIAV